LGKHGGKKEFGNITKEQYYEQAFNLSLKDADGKTIFRKALSNGRMATYNKNTNELVILHDGVEIGTYFKPSRGIDYFNDLK
jgi:pyocin large subunit-like protein